MPKRQADRQISGDKTTLFGYDDEFRTISDMKQTYDFKEDGSSRVSDGFNDLWVCWVLQLGVRNWTSKLKTATLLLSVMLTCLCF